MPIEHEAKILDIDPAAAEKLILEAGSGYADGLLGLPAGHVDLGETPTRACRRRH